MRPSSSLTPSTVRVAIQVRLVVTVQEIVDPPVRRHVLRVGAGLLIGGLLLGSADSEPASISTPISRKHTAALWAWELSCGRLGAGWAAGPCSATQEPLGAASPRTPTSPTAHQPHRAPAPPPTSPTAHQPRRLAWATCIQVPLQLGLSAALSHGTVPHLLPHLLPHLPKPDPEANSNLDPDPGASSNLDPDAEAHSDPACLVLRRCPRAGDHLP